MKTTINYSSGLKITLDDINDNITNVTIEFGTDEQEILLKILIELLDSKILQESSEVDGVQGTYVKILKFNTTNNKYKIIYYCLNLINDFNYHKRINNSKWFKNDFKYIELTREEKLEQIREIKYKMINFIKYEIENEVINDINDYEYYKMKLKKY